MLSLGDIIRILWKWWAIVALTTVCLVGIVAGWTITQVPTYEAGLTMLVRQEEEVAPDSLDDAADGLDQIAFTLTDILDTRIIAQEVIRQLNLQISTDAFLSHLSVEHVNNTQIIYVRYRDSSPERAQRVVNTVTDVFAERVPEVTPSGSGVAVTVWQKAEAPTEPVSPNYKLNLTLALLMGLTLGAVLAYSMESLANSRRSPEGTRQSSQGEAKQMPRNESIP